MAAYSLEEELQAAIVWCERRVMSTTWRGYYSASSVYPLCHSSCDKLVAESIARQVLHAMLLRERCYDASGKVPGEVLSQEDKVLKPSSCSDTSAGEVTQVGLSWP